MGGGARGRGWAGRDCREGNPPRAGLKELLPPPVADVIHRNGLYGKLI